MFVPTGRATVRRAVAALAAALALTLHARPLDAHAHLVSSSPSAGATLASSPTEVRLVFSESVTLSLTTIAIVPASAPPITLAPRLAEGSRRIVTAPIATALAGGRYTVRWRTVAADGHPASGTIAFSISAAAIDSARGTPAAPGVESATSVAPQAESASATASPPVAPGSEPTSRSALPASTFDVESPLYVAVRWVLYGAALAVIGACAFILLVAERIARVAPERRALLDSAEARVRRVASSATQLLALAMIARLAAQTYVVGAGTQFPLGAILGTPWGWSWLLGFLGSVAAIGGVAVAARSRTGWRITAAGVVAVALSFSLTGHAAATPHFALALVVVDAIHVLAAGGWLGTLLMVAGAALAVALRVEPEERGRAAADVLRVFSPLALTCAGVLLVSGVIAAWVHLAGLPSLWQSTYGQVLLVKLALFLLVVALGAFNWRSLTPRLGTDGAVHRIRRSASMELSVGVLVLLATAILVAAPTPATDTGAPPATASATP